LDRPDLVERPLPRIDLVAELGDAGVTTSETARIMGDPDATNNIRAPSVIIGICSST